MCSDCITDGIVDNADVACIIDDLPCKRRCGFRMQNLRCGQFHIRERNTVLCSKCGMLIRCFLFGDIMTQSGNAELVCIIFSHQRGISREQCAERTAFALHGIGVRKTFAGNELRDHAGDGFNHGIVV